MSGAYIGLMSGTSLDGIDAVLVTFDNSRPRLVASHSHDIPRQLREKLKLLCRDSDLASIDMLGEADCEMGELLADAANTLLSSANISHESVVAIGSHGQTIRHRPDLPHPFSMQIGDGNRISYLTGITTVCDFRRKDMAAGGEGAPLAPAFHQQVFHSPEENRAILNIGGIANLTSLPASTDKACFGFDTGPGNGLMDAWIHTHKQLDYDRNGAWAASATADHRLVKQLMSDTFIQQAPPKSTGKEHYNLDWLAKQLTDFSHLSPQQVQASLCEFTSQSIATGVSQHMPDSQRLIVCGGGAHNYHLMDSLSKQLPEMTISSSEEYGIHPDWVEAMAFAWLARQTLQAKPGNLPAVTGASRPLVLGAIYPA